MEEHLKLVESIKEINRQIMSSMKKISELYDEDAFLTVKLQRLMERKKDLLEKMQLRSCDTNLS